MSKQTDALAFFLIKTNRAHEHTTAHSFAKELLTRKATAEERIGDFEAALKQLVTQDEKVKAELRNRFADAAYPACGIPADVLDYLNSN